MIPAERMGAITPYFFSSLGKRIVELRAQGKDVIRLDMGSPDLPPPDFIIDKLVENARNKTKHGYTLGSGTHEFRAAAAAHYAERFGVELDPKHEVIDLIGSKEGLFITSQVLLNPGDISLVPDPGYGVYSSGTQIAGGEVYYMPLLADNQFLPDLGKIPRDVIEKAKILWLNYPNNPTGAVAPKKFFAEVVEFARKNNLLIAHDAPYVDVTFDGYEASSLLQIPGAKEVGVEFNSLSKAYNMAGWRLGMALGNPEVLSLIESYKSQQDSAIFAPILAAGAAALLGDQSWMKERNEIYQARRDLTVSALREAGLVADVPKAALYVWVRIPAGETSIEFCARMLEEIGVSTTPGVVFGEHGEGYLRISLVSSIERMKQGMDRVLNWLQVRV